MFAARNPPFEPQSYRVPPKGKAPAGSRSSSAEIASVSWISPPAPAAVFSSASKIPGVSTYRPTTPSVDGASAGAGFSTMPRIGPPPSSGEARLTMP